MGGVALLLVLFVFASGSAWGQNVIYETGFDSGEGFKAGTTYNNPVPAKTGSVGRQWSTVYGTPSTTSALSGGQSLQMRIYKNQTVTPYTETDFSLADVTSVSFNATYTTTQNSILVQHSNDEGKTWSTGEIFKLTTSKPSSPYEYKVEGDNSSLRFRFSLTVTEVKSTSRVTLDDVTFYGVASKVSAPEFSYTETTFTEPFTLTASCATEGATIHYTYGDEVPTATSPEFPAGGIDISTTTTVNAIAVMADGSLEPSGVVSVTYTKEIPVAPFYNLVTSEDELETGVSYLIVGFKNGVYKALATQNTNNRRAVDIDVKNGNQISTLPEDAALLKLGGDETSGWTFYDEVKNGYLYATSSTDNYLRTQSEADANSEADVVFTGEDNKVQITFKGDNSHNILKYNPSSNLFSCYQASSANMENVWLFKQLSYTRNVVNGNYGTICLPYAVQASDISGAVFFSVDGKKMTDGKPSSVVITEVESLEAGKPYIFQATADKIVLAYSGEEATVAGSDNGFIGSFEGKTFDGNPGGNLYLLVQNKIMAIGATAGGRIGTNRAYFDLDAMDEFTGPLNAKQRVFSFNGGVTGIESVTVDADALVDVYAVSGVRVRHAVRMDVATEGLPAGVYVVNGKKVVVK